MDGSQATTKEPAPMKAPKGWISHDLLIWNELDLDLDPSDLA